MWKLGAVSLLYCYIVGNINLWLVHHVTWFVSSVTCCVDYFSSRHVTRLVSVTRSADFFSSRRVIRLVCDVFCWLLLVASRDSSRLCDAIYWLLLVASCDSSRLWRVLLTTSRRVPWLVLSLWRDLLTSRRVTWFVSSVTCSVDYFLSRHVTRLVSVTRSANCLSTITASRCVDVIRELNS